MLDTKNKIGNIDNSAIETINQLNIEKQNNENNISLTTNNNYNQNTQIVTNITNVIVNSINPHDNKYNEVSVSHCLYPYYKVDFENSNDGRYFLCSKPTCEEANKKYPKYFKSNFSVIDERFKDIKDSKLLLDRLMYADTPVEIKTNDFKQYLGPILDPYPNPDLLSSKECVKTYLMPPKREIPEFNIVVDMKFSNSNYKYLNVNFKLVKQLSSHEFILNNEHQKNSNIFFQFLLDYGEKEINCKLNYKINSERINESNTILDFNEFILNILTKKYFMYDVNKQSIALSGRMENKLPNDELEGTKHYIEIIRRIIKIEHYFNIKFNVPNEILKHDVKVINQLYRYIVASEKRIRGIDMNFSLVKKDTNFKQLKELVELPSTNMIYVSSKLKFDILDKKILIKEIKETYENIKLSNVDEIKNIIDNYDNMKDDEIIKIIMKPVKKKYLYKKTEIVQ